MFVRATNQCHTQISFSWTAWIQSYNKANGKGQEYPNTVTIVVVRISYIPLRGPTGESKYFFLVYFYLNTTAI